MQEPTFAKCIRSTLSTIKQFSLTAFKVSSLGNVPRITVALQAMLPKFVDCVEEIVQAKCGGTPIRVSLRCLPAQFYRSPLQILKAISSPDICPMSAGGKKIVPIAPVKVR